ncbi:MAG: CHAT domain-containing protein [Gloeomargarita sp. HHBFW_bins_162]
MKRRHALTLFGLGLTGTLALPHRTVAQPVIDLDPRTLGFDPVDKMENLWKNQYAPQLQMEFSEPILNQDQVGADLQAVVNLKKQRAGLIYLVPRSTDLELLLVLPGGRSVVKLVTEAVPDVLEPTVNRFLQTIRDPRQLGNQNYLAPAQQLYRWMITPLEPTLQAENINAVIFCAGPGLRTLPFAALHDGQQFLIEKYAVGRMPAYSLTNQDHARLDNLRILAMGASEFRDQAPLPAVPVELATITSQLWRGDQFLNESFTIEQLQKQKLQSNYNVVHLATHADFRPGAINNSYIQFWDRPLRLHQLAQLPWRNLDLLVLSACRTAVGDKGAEMGFAGVAAKAGVKSVLASLWYVSDEGTLALMTEFYRQMQNAPMKITALQRAQVALLRNQVAFRDGELVRAGQRGGVSLPTALSFSGERNLIHPYYWAAFTLVGNPW